MLSSVAIVGAGAVGLALAHDFFKTGSIDVDLFGRNGPYTGPLAVEDLGQSFLWETAASKAKAYQAIFFTVKSYDLKSALDDWLNTPADQYFLLGNGYLEPIIAPYRRKFPNKNFVKGVVTRGARFNEQGVLILSDGGAIKWGLDGCALRQDKWYCNTVLNTLSGAFRLPDNGAALLREEFDELSEEVYELGCEVFPEWRKSGEKQRLRALVESMIRATSANENSMAVDVRLGRRTEIGVLSGIAEGIEGHERRFPLLRSLGKMIEGQKL